MIIILIIVSIMIILIIMMMIFKIYDLSNNDMIITTIGIKKIITHFPSYIMNILLYI